MFFPANFTTKTFAIEKKRCMFAWKTLRDRRKVRGKPQFPINFQYYPQSQWQFTRFYSPRDQRLEWLRNSNAKTWRNKKNCIAELLRFENFLQFREQKLLWILNLDYRRNFRKKCQKMLKLRNFLPAKVSVLKVPLLSYFKAYFTTCCIFHHTFTCEV